MAAIKTIWMSGLLLCSTAWAAETWHRPIEVRQAPAPIVVDGELEDAWLDGAVAYDLRDHLGRNSNLIVENYLTLVRMLADDEYWYIAFVCSDDRPTATLVERDAPIFREDICELMVQSPDGRLLRELSISPLGTVYDAALFWNRQNRFEVSSAWNIEGLKSAVGKTVLAGKPERCVWTVELAIPWKGLQIARPAKGGMLYGNLLRYKNHLSPEHMRVNDGRKNLFLSLYPTGIRGWPAGPSSLGRLCF